MLTSSPSPFAPLAELRQAKIGQVHRAPVFRHEDVPRLDITMRNSLGMAIRHCIDELPHNTPHTHFALLEERGVACRGKSPALAQVKNECSDPDGVIDDLVVDGDNVRVGRDEPMDSRLPPEPLEGGARVFIRCGEPHTLDRSILARDGVGRGEDSSKGAFAEEG